MVQVIKASNLELHNVKARFNLQEIRDLHFFPEWQGELPSISDFEKQLLDKVKEDFLSISEYPLSEEIVKLVVLSPLLSSAGLTRFPFIPDAEKPVEIVFEEEEEVIRGRIDVLSLHQGLWVIIVEAKRHSLNVREGLAQALFHMMSSPDSEKHSFSLLLNGSDFLFVKLVKQNFPQYSLSRLFSLTNPGNDLYSILAILKRLREIALR